MSISHVCLSCGFDLARVRAVREPHYGWPLVRCPFCATCSVRRRHPLQRAWRNFLRLDWALSMLLIQAILLIAALAMTWGLAATLYAAAVVHVFDHDVLGLPWILCFALCIAPIAVGAWLRAAYAHWPWWRAWLTWGLIVLVPVNALALAAPLGISAPAYLTIGADSIAAKIALTWLVMCLPISSIAGVMILLTPAGIPLGRLLLWLHDRARAARYRLRRKRLRRARRA